MIRGPVVHLCNSIFPTVLTTRTSRGVGPLSPYNRATPPGVSWDSSNPDYLKAEPIDN